MDDLHPPDPGTNGAGTVAVAYFFSQKHSASREKFISFNTAIRQTTAITTQVITTKGMYF